MTKQLPTLGVLGVYTGVVLEDGGFVKIHEVLDHLYPGIMTLGCAMMADTAKAEVLRQHPEFASLPPCGKSNYRQFAADAIVRFGETISLEGPHGTGGPEMRH